MKEDKERKWTVVHCKAPQDMSVNRPLRQRLHVLPCIHLPAPPPPSSPVTAVFTLAHKLQPAIIFIDEVDSFLGQRRQSEHEAVTNMKTEFMSLWDGFSTDGTIRPMCTLIRPRSHSLPFAPTRSLPH